MAQPSEATTARSAGKRRRRDAVVIVPAGWADFDDLVCGFGARDDAPAGAPATMIEQVHGDRVVVAEEISSARVAVRADAITVRSFGLVAAIKTADCAPILLVSPEAGWAAVIHAGWRGTVVDIAQTVVDAAADVGVSAKSLSAAIGPAIGPCCYEVGEEVATRFEEVGLAVGRDGPKPVLDLREINRGCLLNAGLSHDRIQLCGPCTRCHSDRYWSFRADGERAGRQLSWIGWEHRKPGTDR